MALPALRKTLLLCTLGCGFPAAACWSQEDPVLRDAAARDVGQDPAHWRWWADALLRWDAVHGLPARPDLERARVRARLGATHIRGAHAWNVALKVAAGSDRNADRQRNNDNERSDGAWLDEWSWRWQADEWTAVRVGKSPLPLALTPLTWDADLRPVGASVERYWELDTIHRLEGVVGYFLGDHLYGDGMRLAAAQLAWQFGAGSTHSGEVRLGYLGFVRAGNVVADGSTRTNLRSGLQLAHPHRLLDAQAAWRHEAGGWPLRMQLDLVRNLAVDRERDGVRLSAIVGDRAIPAGWEFGLAWQRVQREAVVAAYNSDDWWFHSAARGVMPWVAYGFDARWSAQLAGFLERRDDQPRRVRRVLLDVRANW